MDVSIIIFIAFIIVVVVVAVVMIRRGGGSGVVVVPTRPAHSAATDDDLSALLARGSTIEAIKQVRARTGLGLKEAKDYVDALQSGQAPPRPLPPATANGVAIRPPSPALEQAVRAMRANGQLIQAIKLVREQTGMGLKEAKDYVERIK